MLKKSVSRLTCHTGHNHNRQDGAVKLVGLDKGGYPVNIFSYFSTKTYVVGTH